MYPTVELLPNSGKTGTTGASSWYYSNAPPSQSVSAMPKPEDLRARKAKTAAVASITAPSFATTAASASDGTSDVVVKLDPATVRRINELEKVNWHDVQIKIEAPFSGRKPGKTQNVRRVLASQKTFQNHLSDDIANHELQLQNPLYKPDPYDPATTPLGYVRSVAEPPSTNATRYRRFCEICGYWGTIGCLRCGVRLCSGECEATHKEARCTRRF
ncbi:hypothetical protein H072_1741 [Dactylellina haptotyla CBS 200.50]|uniref:HIT-type domain-containing protein n=1 Tax=Dactylellina haptotyla (strain CBS 200.50) TaxID=1284197 RepID=S8AMY3_DACHA|nr:hypothetical protein H072_1741 [Dactylellina haptotyla CBS 200.50]